MLQETISQLELDNRVDEPSASQESPIIAKNPKLKISEKSRNFNKIKIGWQTWNFLHTPISRDVQHSKQRLVNEDKLKFNESTALTHKL